MKKLLAVLLSATTFAACGQKPEAVITGTVTGIPDGSEICLQNSAGAHLYHVLVENGKFRIEFPEVYGDQMALVIHGSQWAFPFFLEPGTITASVDIGGEDEPTASFTGTPSNDALKGLQENSPASFDEQDRILRSTIFDNPNTVLAAYLVYGLSQGLGTSAEIDSVLTIVADAPKNAFTDRLRDRRRQLAASGIGAQAPDFTQNRPDGTPFSLVSLRGKLVLIDFWASWCGPCRAENPNVVKMYERFRERGFEIVGVSLDDDRTAWLKAIEDDRLTWIHVSDLGGWQNSVAQRYGVTSIPHTVLVGPDGDVIAKNLRGAALEAKIAEVLGAK